jgi:hypothetical protein
MAVTEWAKGDNENYPKRSLFKHEHNYVDQQNIGQDEVAPFFGEKNKERKAPKEVVKVPPKRRFDKP